MDFFSPKFCIFGRKFSYTEKIFRQPKISGEGRERATALQPPPQARRHCIAVCSGAKQSADVSVRVCERTQQGYECTRRYLEELVTARTQRLTQSSRHTSLSAPRPASHHSHVTRLGLATMPTTRSAILTTDQTLREMAANDASSLLPNH